MEPECASFLVVEEVARIEGVPPEELSPPLGTIINPEALDQLVQSIGPSEAGSAEITFGYQDYTVQVEKKSEVTVSVRDDSVSSRVSDAV